MSARDDYPLAAHVGEYVPPTEDGSYDARRQICRALDEIDRLREACRLYEAAALTAMRGLDAVCGDSPE